MRPLLFTEFIKIYQHRHEDITFYYSPKLETKIIWLIVTALKTAEGILDIIQF